MSHSHHFNKDVLFSIKCVVAVDMIDTFIDESGYCFFSYQRIHREFEIKLKGVRCSKVRFTSVEVYLILQDLYNTGIVNKNWSHFFFKIQ